LGICLLANIAGNRGVRSERLHGACFNASTGSIRPVGWHLIHLIHLNQCALTYRVMLLNWITLHSVIGESIDPLFVAANPVV
jgi:hypothetical protein